MWRKGKTKPQKSKFKTVQGKKGKRKTKKKKSRDSGETWSSTQRGGERRGGHSLEFAGLGQQKTQLRPENAGEGEKSRNITNAGRGKNQTGGEKRANNRENAKKQKVRKDCQKKEKKKSL